MKLRWTTLTFDMHSRTVNEADQKMTSKTVIRGQLRLVTVLDMMRVTHYVTDTDAVIHRLVCHMHHYTAKIKYRY